MTLTVTRQIAADDARTMAALLRNGYLKIYDGRRPASPHDPPVGAALLIVCRFDTFDIGADGRATAHTVYSAPAVRSGRPTWFRTTTSAGAPVYDGDAAPFGTAADMNLEDIEQGQPLVLDEFSFA
jgi:hypothetical protein